MGYARQQDDLRHLTPRYSTRGPLDGRASWGVVRAPVGGPYPAELRLFGPHPAGQAQPSTTPPATPPPAPGPSCPAPAPCATLPSSESAFAFVRGDRGSSLLLARDLIVRSSLVALGMYAVGERQHLWRNAIAGGVAIELFVLLWINATMGPARS